MLQVVDHSSSHIVRCFETVVLNFWQKIISGYLWSQDSDNGCLYTSLTVRRGTTVIELRPKIWPRLVIFHLGQPKIAQCIPGFTHADTEMQRPCSEWHWQNSLVYFTQLNADSPCFLRYIKSFAIVFFATLLDPRYKGRNSGNF